MSQRSRRQDPYPWTWEMPLAVILAVLVLISFGVHLGRAIANVLAGSRLEVSEPGESVQ